MLLITLCLSTFITLSSLSLTQSASEEQQRCVFGFATCGIANTMAGGVPIPCVYNGPPKPVNDQSLLDELDQLCPALDVLSKPNKPLCCGEEQIQQFLSSMKNYAIPFLGSCPSCLINFSQLFCDEICNPDQASFLKVIASAPYGNTTHFTVKEVNYNISNKFPIGMFNSCKNVYSTAISGPALNVMCGDNCTPEGWLEFLGNTDNSPYKTNFNLIDKDATIIPCNTSVGSYYPRLNDSYPSKCSRIDCPADTPTPDIKPPSPTPRIVETVGAYVLVTFTFIIFAALISVVFDSCFDHRSIDTILKNIFRRWALLCARNATLVILLGLACVIFSCVGLTKLQILTDPVNLWSQPNSQAHQEKLYFEDSFGPYFRIEQVVIYPTNGSKPWYNYTDSNGVTTEFSNVFELGFLNSTVKLQKRILELNATVDDRTIGITDICFKPLKNNFCAIQSPIDWFQGNETNFILEDPNKNGTENINQYILDGSNDKPRYLEHFLSCFQNSFNLKDTHYNNLSCFGPYGGPLQKNLVLGGYPGNEYWKANSLVITIPVRNSHSPMLTKIAKAWERKFIDLLSNYSDPNLEVAFYSERSIEDEIERQSQSDVFTIAISYLVMLVYVAVSLGRSSSLDNFFVESRIVLGLGGVLIVLASVLASIGILSFFGVRATLIIIEVIPFLVLAVGVDNIFIIVQALQRSANNADLVPCTLEERISIVIGDVGPSLLLASLSESACFLIGTLTPMPAVRVFAMTASLALLVDFILQLTVFIGLLTIDTKRQSSGRYDLICCFTASKSSQTSLIGSPELDTARSHPSRRGLSSLTDSSSGVASITNHIERSNGYQSDTESKPTFPSSHRDPLHCLFENYIAPFLMRKEVRFISMFIFLAWLCVSAFVIPKIDVGLDQTMSVPEDSYMQNYFESQRRDLKVGPPVYFVLKRGLDFTNKTERHAICYREAGCSENSLVNQIANASKNQNSSYLANITFNSWIDDYLTWGLSECCQMKKPHVSDVRDPVDLYQPFSERISLGDEFCPSDTPNINTTCTHCNLTSKFTFNQENFYYYLDYFLKDVPRQSCPTAGGPQYSNQVSEFKHSKTIDSSFLTYHVPLKDSKDFIEAMKSARTLAHNIESTLNSQLRRNPPSEQLHVFPYCFTYVFYEQYLTIWQQAIRNLSISMVTIFVVSYLLLGCDLYISMVILGTIASIIIDLMGLMYFWNVQMNAISLVNLVMSVGISVEFCSHVARSFALSKKDDAVDRAQDALIKMGSSVLSGITLTKIAGISILAFAKSRIFKVYYFRMYMGIVLVGAIHGIIFMPIILSLTAKNRKTLRQSQLH